MTTLATTATISNSSNSNLPQANSSSTATPTQPAKKSRPKTASPTRHGPQQCQVFENFIDYLFYFLVSILGNKKSMRLFESQETHLVCLQCRYKNIISWYLQNKEWKVVDEDSILLQFHIYFLLCLHIFHFDSILHSFFDILLLIWNTCVCLHIYHVEWQIRFKRNENRKSLLQHFWRSAKFAIPNIPFDDHANVCFFYSMLCILYLHSIKHIIMLSKKIIALSSLWVGIKLHEYFWLVNCVI
jgi:hypothetical protein